MSQKLKMSYEDLQQILTFHPELAVHLFEKGFLITDAEITDTENYPFWGNWHVKKMGAFNVWIHNGTRLHIHESDGCSLFLIGHAYNPYSLESSEERILESIARQYSGRLPCTTVDELTGVFFLGAIKGTRIEFLLDASGMQYGCYGTIAGKHYITSHMRLVGDFLRLKTANYVERLIHYRWYRYMLGSYLPGDLTCYKELTRIIPNTSVILESGLFRVDRFYPNRPLQICQNDKDYTEVIKEASKILKNTMALIPEKWNKPAISLTGGIDSNTTFAAANGLYDKYSTFSYVSMFRESIDAEKAREISQHFNVSFRRIDIPDNNSECENFSLFKQIFDYNQGGIGSSSDSDSRKKITLIKNDICDVEVKSWISETIRAYAYKYFGRKRFPARLSPRNYTSLYKIFLLNRKLVLETDKYFKQYFEHTSLLENLYNYDHSDFFVWEMMHGGKCGLNIGVMKSCFDITIPYNNRKLLDLLLRIPLEKRISDQHHLDLKAEMNRELFDMNIRVVNLNETKARKRLINLYYMLNSALPF